MYRGIDNVKYLERVLTIRKMKSLQGINGLRDSCSDIDGSFVLNSFKISLTGQNRVTPDRATNNPIYNTRTRHKFKLYSWLSRMTFIIKLSLLHLTVRKTEETDKTRL